MFELRTDHWFRAGATTPKLVIAPDTASINLQLTNAIRNICVTLRAFVEYVMSCSRSQRGVQLELYTQNRGPQLTCQLMRLSIQVAPFLNASRQLALHGPLQITQSTPPHLNSSLHPIQPTIHCWCITAIHCSPLLTKILSPALHRPILVCSMNDPTTYGRNTTRCGPRLPFSKISGFQTPVDIG